MTDRDHTVEGLDELEGELLPDREALSVINPLGDPELSFEEPPPKGGSEPGLPPPRD